MDRAYEARTHEQLDVLTADLPEARPAQAQQQKRRWLVSVMGGNERAEDVARDETVSSLMGGIDVRSGSRRSDRKPASPQARVTSPAAALAG